MSGGPVEGELQYFYGAAMGTGWYIYQSGQWLPWGEDNSSRWEMSPGYWGQCECGAEKAKQPGHSSWCPKFQR
jgi:hypothetical protein